MDFLAQFDKKFKSPLQAKAQQKDPIADWVEELYARCKTHRRVYDENWEQYLKFYYNQQWPLVQRPPADWKAWLTINYIFSIIQSIVAVLLDSKPKINVTASSPEQQPYAHVIQAALDSIQYRRRSLQIITDALTNALILGNGYVKTYWDEELENGKGDIAVKVVPSENLYVDPEATDLLDAHYVLECRQVPLSYIARYWPEKAKSVKPDLADNFGSYKQRREDGMWGHRGNFSTLGGPPFRMTGPITGGYGPLGDNPLVADQTQFSSPSYRPAYKSSDWVTLYELWIRDHSMETREIHTIVTDPMTGIPMSGVERIEIPKYPHGRLIYVAGGLTLHDSPSPYKMWPYAQFKDINRPGEFYAMGEVEILQDLQLEVNKRRSQMTDHAVLMGNPITKVTRSSQLDPDTVVNKPGAIYVVNKPDDLIREPGVPMPQFMPALADNPIRDMREISGVSALPSGQPPRGVRSGSGFEAAQNIANTRIRTKARNLEQSLEDIGRIMISHIQQFYTTPRMIRIMGNNGQASFIPFDGKMLRGDWDLHIEAGSTMPQTKAVRAQQAIQLYQMKAIDVQALLDCVEFPDKEAVLRRMGMITPSIPHYPGYPGMPDRDSKDYSGYALAVQHAPMAPPPMPGPMGPPPGMPLPPPPGMPPPNKPPGGGHHGPGGPVTTPQSFGPIGPKKGPYPGAGPNGMPTG